MSSEVEKEIKRNQKKQHCHINLIQLCKYSNIMIDLHKYECTCMCSLYYCCKLFRYQTKRRRRKNENLFTYYILVKQKSSLNKSMRVRLNGGRQRRMNGCSLTTIYIYIYIYSSSIYVCIYIRVRLFGGNREVVVNKSRCPYFSTRPTSRQWRTGYLLSALSIPGKYNHPIPRFRCIDVNLIWAVDFFFFFTISVGGNQTYLGIHQVKLDSEL
jgi:hypothetical protein